MPRTQSTGVDIPVQAGSQADTSVRPAGERSTDLVAEQDCDAQLFGGWASDPAGGGEDEVAVDDATLFHDERDLLVDREAISFEVRAVTWASDLAVVVEDGNIRARTEAGDERAGVDAEHFDDLAPHLMRQLLRRLEMAGDEFCGADHALQIPRRTTSSCLLAATPERQLGDSKTDKEQENGGLDIGAVADSEVAVGLGEEEVERGAAGERRHHPGTAVASGRNGDDDENQDKDRRGQGKAVSKDRHETSQQQWQGGRTDDDNRPVSTHPLFHVAS